MISRRTRSRTAPGLETNCAGNKTCPCLRPTRRRKTDPSANSRRRKSTTHGQQQLTSPTFTWDIPKTHKQIIYDDLGVKEMDVGGAVARVLAHGADKKARTSGILQNKDTEEVKGHLVSPDQFKSHQEHLPNGHTCSCKKQLLLEKSDDPFCRLSDEVMLGIFWWLPITKLAHCARVCKRWHYLVSKSGTNLTLKPVLHLQYLDLTASDTKPHQLAEIIRHCPRDQIKKLSLESCAVSDDVMARVADRGGGLKELNLCMCSGLTEAGLGLVLKGCFRVQSLNLAWTNLSQKMIEAFLKTVPRTIEKLNLSGCRQTLKTSDVLSLAYRCIFIKELDLSDATMIGFEAIDAIINHMTQLQHIALSRCYSIPRLSFVQLGTLKYLRALDIFGLVNEPETLDSMKELLPGIQINIFPFSAIARPTTTKKRSNIWEVSCYE